MPERIKITPEELRNMAGDFRTNSDHIIDMLQTIYTNVNNLESVWDGAGQNEFLYQFHELQDPLGRFPQALTGIATTLDNVAQTFEDADRLLASGMEDAEITYVSSNGSPGRQGSTTPSGGSYNSNSGGTIAIRDSGPLEQYNGVGSYGGNQGSPLQNFDDVADIVRSRFPDMTDSQIEQYLATLNSHGCAYVAVTNTIFTVFRDRPDDFEQTFGFPMHTDDGDLNYNAMIVDFYVWAGRNQGVAWWNIWTCRDQHAAENGAGLALRSAEQTYWEDYLRERDINVRMERGVEVTAENFAEVSQNGEIIVSMRPLSMYNCPNQSDRHDNRKGGHAVVITGVTEDGLLSVSTWGQRWYIDPVADADKFEFIQVIYE